MYNIKYNKTIPLMKQIKGFSNYYADTKGNIYTKGSKGFVLTKLTGSKEHRNGGKKEIKKVRIIDDSGTPRTMKVHRLIATTWKPNIYNKATVNHEDGDTLNNSAINLSWMTIQENWQHAKDNHLINHHGSTKKPKSVQLDIFKGQKVG